MSLLSPFMQPQHLLLALDVVSQSGLFDSVAVHLARFYPLNPVVIRQALLAREALGSTAVGQGMAIPHARLPQLTRPIVVFARPLLPMAFNAPDAKPVSDLIILLMPSESNDLHLQLLAEIAGRLAQKEFRTRLRHCSSAEQLRVLWD